MKKPAMLLAVLSGGMFLYGAPTLVDGVLTYEVAETESAIETSQFTSYGAVTTVVKQGAGTLTVNADNSAYAGPVEITAGTFVAAHAGAVAKAANIYVRDKAQFKITFTSGGQDSRHIAGNLHIIGSGPDGSGAVFMANGGMGDNIFGGTFYLDGDATIGGWSRAGFYTLMNGHTLTDAITTEHIFKGVNADKPGHIIYTGGSRFVVSGTMNGTADNTLTLAKEGASVCFWNYSARPPWTLLVNESGSIAGGAADNNDRNQWGGPIIIAKGKFLTFGEYNANKPSGARGEISGEGALISSGNSGHASYLWHANSYTGGTQVLSGYLYAQVAGSIPETGPITVNGGNLVYRVDEGAWTFDEIAKRIKNTSVPNGSVRFYTSAGQTVTDALGIDLGGSSAMGIGHDGPGELITTGKIAGGVLNNWEGTWTISPSVPGSSAQRIRLLNGAKGKMVFKDAGDWYFGKGIVHEIGSANTPRLVIDNTVIGGAETTSGNNWGAKMRVGADWGTRGILEVVGDKASITNWINIGDSSKSAGAFYQRGGQARMSCNSTADGVWGGSGYAYYEGEGGFLSIGHCNNVGRYAAGTGILRMTGGTASAESDIFIGSGGTGVLHVAKGTFKCSGNLRLGQYQWAVSTKVGESVMTIDGPEAVADVWTLCLGQRPAPAYSVLNLNAGVLKIGTSLARMQNGGASAIFYTAADEPTAYVNFNGGTLRGPTWNSNYFSSTDLLKPTRITAFAGGAVLDANGAIQTATMPIEAPTGWGVKAIALPADFPTSGWIGPQHVTIRGGSGHGATAITDFDSESGTISKIIVTSPGLGYAADDTLEATMPDANYTATLTCGTVTLEELVPGGLTVTNCSDNAGTVVLACANTYGGGTTVAAGTLRPTAEGAIPNGSPITVVAGRGVLDMSAIGRFPDASTLTIDTSALPEGKPESHAARHLTLVKGVTKMPTVTNKDSLPYPWRVGQEKDGTITLSYGVGLVILVQ